MPRRHQRTDGGGASAPRCMAVLGRFRVERRANGEALSVMTRSLWPRRLGGVLELGRIARQEIVRRAWSGRLGCARMRPSRRRWAGRVRGRCRIGDPARRCCGASASSRPGVLEGERTVGSRCAGLGRRLRPAPRRNSSARPAGRRCRARPTRRSSTVSISSPWLHTSASPPAGSTKAQRSA